MAQLELFSHLHAETVAAVGGASSGLRIQSQLNAFAQKPHTSCKKAEAVAVAEADGSEEVMPCV